MEEISLYNITADKLRLVMSGLSQSQRNELEARSFLSDEDLQLYKRVYESIIDEAESGGTTITVYERHDNKFSSFVGIQQYLKKKGFTTDISFHEPTKVCPEGSETLTVSWGIE